MIVNKIYILLLVLFVSVISCQKRQDEQEKNTYEILSYLINRYTGKNADLPPPPPPLHKDKFTVKEISLKEGVQGRWRSKQDSIEFYKKYEKIVDTHKKETANKMYIIGVIPYFKTIFQNIFLDSIYIKDYQQLIDKMKHP